MTDAAFIDRFRELCTCCDLDLPKGLWEQSLPRLYEAVLQANETHNLTRITDLDEFLVKHLLDSLLVLKLQPELLTCTGQVADVGCGGGFPGLPLALLCSQAQFTEIDTSRKKVQSVVSIIESLKLTDRCRALHGKARELGRQADFQRQFDIVLARAVSDTPSLIKECRHLLKPGGCLIAYKTPGQVADEAKLTRREARKAKLSVEESAILSLPDGAGERQFVRLYHG